MIELLRTNDLVLISCIESLLEAQGVGFFIADQHMSALEGSARGRRACVAAASICSRRRAATASAPTLICWPPPHRWRAD